MRKIQVSLAGLVAIVLGASLAGAALARPTSLIVWGTKLSSGNVKALNQLTKGTGIGFALAPDDSRLAVSVDGDDLPGGLDLDFRTAPPQANVIHMTIPGGARLELQAGVAPGSAVLGLPGGIRIESGGPEANIIHVFIPSGYKLGSATDISVAAQ